MAKIGRRSDDNTEQSIRPTPTIFVDLKGSVTDNIVEFFLKVVSFKIQLPIWYFWIFFLHWNFDIKVFYQGLGGLSSHVVGVVTGGYGEEEWSQ